jgi:hypothetical protein
VSQITNRFIRISGFTGFAGFTGIAGVVKSASLFFEEVSQKRRSNPFWKDKPMNRAQEIPGSGGVRSRGESRPAFASRAPKLGFAVYEQGIGSPENNSDVPIWDVEEKANGFGDR